MVADVHTTLHTSPAYVHRFSVISLQCTSVCFVVRYTDQHRQRRHVCTVDDLML